MRKTTINKFITQGKGKGVFITIVIATVIVVTMLALYFWCFSGGLSNNSSNWGDFGSYFGSITGLLAFVGVLYTLHLSNKQNVSLQQYNNETSERDSFFKMLDVHNSKVINMEFHISNDTLRGAKAFKKFVYLMNYRLKFYVFCRCGSPGIVYFDSLRPPITPKPFTLNDFKEFQKQYPENGTEVLDGILKPIREDSTKRIDINDL